MLVNIKEFAFKPEIYFTQITYPFILLPTILHSLNLLNALFKLCLLFIVL